MSIADKVVDKHHDITDEELKEMLELQAQSGLVNDRLKGDYFQILKRRTVEEYNAGLYKNQLDALNTVHKHLYSIVCSVYGKYISDSKERNKATNFARSAVSVLRKAIKSGLDVSFLTTKTKTVEKIKDLQTPKEPEEVFRNRCGLLRNFLNKAIVNNEITTETARNTIQDYFGDIL